jgi:tripartite-type tricarboxylate transporter receptor subunit TctC
VFPVQQADSEQSAKRLAVSMALAALPLDNATATRFARANRVAACQEPNECAAHGCRDLLIYCNAGRCHHSATMNAGWRPAIVVAGVRKPAHNRKSWFPRRTFLHLAAGAAVLPVLSRIALAQSYPARPVRFVHGFAAGGSGDIAARLIGQLLSDRLGQQFVVENRTGAGGNIAVETVARAPADGYTLLQLNVANTINTALYERLNFNLLNDIVPVASFMRAPNVMEVTPSLPVKTVPEFIAYAKANPGKISFASSVVGSSIHMSGELFKAMAKIDMLHVPYRGIAAGGLSDLMTGVVHVAFDNLPSSIELIRAGKLRALAVTTTARSELLPDVPTVGDFLPGYEASAWYGVGAPKGTPAEIVERLNKETHQNVSRLD